jgi:NAD(P)-dependent dehydrogenase (short-subunit alcohol dehydrogenase family)
LSRARSAKWRVRGDLKSEGIDGLIAALNRRVWRGEPVARGTFDFAWLQRRTAALRLLVPLGRIGTPDDLGKAAVFLASDDSGYVTGIELFVDGSVAQI